MQGFMRLFLLVMLSWLWLVFARDAAAWQLMDVYTVDNMQPTQRLQWVEQQLGPYKGLINSTAKKHRIPPRLLGTIIINELADYNTVDKGQETIFSTGSVGMAQINVLTAINHKLVDVREEELRDYIERNYNPKTVPYAFPPNVRKWDYLSEQEKREARQFAMQRIVWHRLNQPEYAIEAAAREASWVMDQMNRNLGRTWQKRLLRGPIDRADPYRNLITDQPYEKDPEKIRINRERALALLVIAAYNTDAIIFDDFFLDNPYYQPQKGVPFYNARTHGINGMDLFAELFVRSQWLPDYGTSRPPMDGPYEPKPEGPKCSDRAAAYHAECDRIFRHCTATHCKVVFSDCYNQCGSCGAGRINETITDKWCQLDPSYLPAAQGALNTYVQATRQCVNLFVAGQLKEPFMNDQKISHCLASHVKRLEEQRTKAIENACTARCAREGRRGVLEGRPMKCMCK